MLCGVVLAQIFIVGALIVQVYAVRYLLLCKRYFLAQLQHTVVFIGQVENFIVPERNEIAQIAQNRYYP